MRDKTKFFLIEIIVMLTMTAFLSTAAFDLDPGDPPTDTTPPTVSITNPSNGQTVSGTITITASASDNVGVSKVEFRIGGSLIGTDYSAPYSVSLNTNNYVDGSYPIQAKAYDACLNYASDTHTISILNRPKVSYTGLVKEKYTLNPVQNAQVKISYSTLTFTTYTTADGVYTFTNIPDYSYNGIVTCSNYYSETFTTLTNNMIITLYNLDFNNIITMNEFNYDNAEVYNNFWETSNVDYFSTSCSDGIAEIYENPGSYSKDAYSSHYPLDLKSWTGKSDLQIEVRIRASSTNKYNKATQFRMGLVFADDIKWSYYNYYAVTDTDWFTIKTVIPKSNLIGVPIDPIIIPLVSFYWGFRDVSSVNYNQKVQIDYFKISGEKKPEGHLVNNQVGTTTDPSPTFTYLNTPHDPDYAAVSMSTSVLSDTLGFATSDNPVLNSMISICLDDDYYFKQYLGETGDYYYNVVEKVIIKTEIFTLSSAGLGGTSITPTIENIKVNEPEPEAQQESFLSSSLLGLGLEAIGLIPTFGSYIKFGLHTLIYIFESQEVTLAENVLNTDVGLGYASAEYYFPENTEGGYMPEPPNYGIDGSSDFQMSLQIQPNILEPGLYRIRVTYDVTYSEIYRYLATTDWNHFLGKISSTHQYIDEFDLIKDSDNPSSEYLIVQEDELDSYEYEIPYIGTMSSKIPIPVELNNPSPSNIEIVNSVNGHQWSIIKWALGVTDFHCLLSAPATQTSSMSIGDLIQITFDLTFEDVKIDFWKSLTTFITTQTYSDDDYDIVLPSSPDSDYPIFIHFDFHYAFSYSIITS
ncbi:MAG: hypothetical protein FK734_18420 [Asgard group archaeon]|nr:hypothetical protein [Asgard group archaeon]